MEEALEKLKPPSPTSEPTTQVNNVDHSSVSFSHDTISVGNMEVCILGTGMTLLTKMGYKG